MLDILDRLQEENRHVVLTLASGERILGRAYSMIWEEDDKGWDTIKAILFKPYGAELYDIFHLEEIESYEIVEDQV